MSENQTRRRQPTDRSNIPSAGPYRPGLGEQLRHLTELVDAGAEAAYAADGLDYRPRYTPVMRALAAGALTVSDITKRAAITQGAVSQTVKLMARDGLIARRPGADARRSELRLTARGQALLGRLEAHWALTFDAILDLEREIGHPLQTTLRQAIAALERRGFAARIDAARASEESTP